MQVQRWRGPTPRLTSAQCLLFTRSGWQCHVLPPPCQSPPLELAREFFFYFLSRSRSVTKEVTASRLEAIVRPWCFFKTCCVPFVEVTRDPLVVCWTLRSHDELELPKTLEKERKSQVKSMLNALGKTGRCLVGVNFTLAWIFLSSPEWGSDRDPAGKTETCEPYETVCVNLALCSLNKVKSWLNSVSKEFAFFASFFFFSFFHFYNFRNGQGQPPPPSPPACPYFGKCFSLLTVSEGGFVEIYKRWKNFDFGNCEVLGSGLGEKKKKENSEVLLSFLPELTRKKNVFFCDKKWPLQYEKRLKNFKVWGRKFLVKLKQTTHSVVFKKQSEAGNPGIHFLSMGAWG